MNKTGFKLAIAVLSVSAGWSRFAAGQEKAASPKTNEPAQAKQGSKKVEDSKKREEGTMGPRVQVQIANIHRLRKMMDEKIQLSPSQTATIDRLFEDYVEDVKNTAVRKKADARQPTENKVLPPTMAQLEKERSLAKARGDQEKFDELGKKMSALRKDPVLLSDSGTEFLTAKIKAELKPDQSAAFDVVLDRWNLIVPRGPRTGPFQQLRRALKDPEVGLSAGQQKEADDLLQQALKTVRSGQSSPEKLAEEVEKVKTVVFEKITPEQRKKLEAILRLFKETEKEYDDSKYRGPHAVKRPQGEKQDGDK